MNNIGNSENILLNKICQDYFSRGSSEDIYVSIREDDFNKLMPLLPEMDVILISLFCVENFGDKPGFTLFYILEKRGCQNFVILLRTLETQKASSVASCFPSACWFEREIRDGFGVEFTDAFDTRRLFLHEAYPPEFHPMLKSFVNRELDAIQRAVPGTKYQYKEVEGEGVYQVLVGPVHAGIIEPGHFHFSVIGETILNLEIRMFFKHRGIEKLAEGKTPQDALPISETISGDETVANAVAFCMAIEKISGIRAPEKAWCLRTIMLEMERIYSHLSDLAGMIVDVAFPIGASEFHILKEEILRYNELLTGSRFMKGIICPGGLRKDIPPRVQLQLTDYLDIFIKRFRKAVNFVHRLDSVIDRLETTGIISPKLVNPLNITGPAARASGIGIDNRIDHPYGIYPAMTLDIHTCDKGDVLNRFEVKSLEVMDSVILIQKLISDIADLHSGAFFQEITLKDGYALTVIEAARGQNLHWVYLKNGVIERYKVRTASFCNWQAIEHAVIGNIVPDFPLINKSLNLSYAGTDL